MTEAGAVFWRPAAIARQYDVSTRTVRAWMDRGVESRGRLVRLPFLWVGRTRRVRPEAWEWFLAALNEERPPAPDPRQRRRLAAAAIKQLWRRLGRSPPEAEEG